jgi:pimeloyl-ACP methyl ester carboxylesterase
LEHKPPSKVAVKGLEVGFRRLAQHYTVYVLGRKPNLPKGYTAQDMSDDCAAMIRTEIGKPVHIMGMSSGGSSAMHFAVDHAELLRGHKLVLAMTAYRLSDHGVRVATIWRDLAVKGDWPGLRERMGVDMTEGQVPTWLTRLAMRLLGKALLGQPTSGSDLAIVLDSDLNLDVRNKLPRITAPTLVIGGDRDPFYGAEAIRETAACIPGAELYLFEGGGHAVVKQKPREFAARILRFLRMG